jgi:hypothetical protein
MGYYNMIKGALMQGIGIDLVYSFVIFLICLLVYLETREISRLSSYKGINFFRNTFLFFGISYLLKFVLALGVVSIDLGTVGEGIFFGVALYASLMAGIYLVMAIGNKQLPKQIGRWIFMIHILAVVFSGIVLLSNNFLVYLGFQILILIIGIVLLYSDGKKTSMLVIYQLLLLFWILDIVEVFVPKFFGTVQLLISLVSIGIFILVLYKIIKSTHRKK